MLDRTLDKAVEAGVTRAVVNTHHLAAQVERRVKARTEPEIVISRETEILDTGGGVLNALDALGEAPFFVLNSDTIWEDGPTPALRRLADAWDPERMDALMLLHPTVAAFGYAGDGDFFMDIEGRLERRGESQIAPFVFTGSQILNPALFDGLKPGRFSLNLVYDRALENGRMFGLRHDGAWYHVGTPDSFGRIGRLYDHLARAGYRGPACATRFVRWRLTAPRPEPAGQREREAAGLLPASTPFRPIGISSPPWPAACSTGSALRRRGSRRSWFCCRPAAPAAPCARRSSG